MAAKVGREETNWLDSFQGRGEDWVIIGQGGSSSIMRGSRGDRKPDDYPLRKPRKWLMDLWKCLFPNLLLITLLVASESTIHAKVIRVPQDSPDLINAVFDGQDGDEIIVSPGIYSGPILVGRSLNIHSIDPQDPAIVASTIIEGKGPTENTITPVVGLSSAPGKTCRLAGFTIRNGGGSGIRGGNSTSVIENCHILDNTGGKHYRSLTASFGKSYERLTFTNDDRQYGGGIFRCDGLIQNNIIERNSSEFGGGLAECNGTIQNNVIVRNRLIDFGGRGAMGAALYNCQGTIRNNTIVDNAISAAGGTQWRGGGLVKCQGPIANNIIWINKTGLVPEYTTCSLPNYSCVKGFSGGGQGNIASDPKLVNAVFDETPGNHTWPEQDWRLKSISPCIDAGKSTQSLKADILSVQRGLQGVQELRGDGSALDIGAFEFIPEPVGVWLPGGGPDLIESGQNPKVAWKLTLPAGTAVLLRLMAQGVPVADFGAFYSAQAEGEETVALPASLPTHDSYWIQARSSWNPSLVSTTPIFRIQNPQNEVTPARWMLYR